MTRLCAAGAALILILPAWAAPARAPRSRPVRKLVRDGRPGTGPQAPIRFLLEPAGAGGGGSRLFRVSVRAMVPATTLQVEVDASEGLRIVGGDPAWRAQASTREASARLLRVVADGPGRQRIGARATLLLPDGTRVSGYASWAGPAPARSLQQEFPGARPAKDRRGRPIIELPADP